MLNSPGKFTTLSRGFLLLALYGPLPALVIAQSWQAPVIVFGVCLIPALAFASRSDRELKEEYARWLDSWSIEMASAKWLKRFFECLGGHNRAGTADARYFSPLAVQMVVASLKSMRRVGPVNRMWVKWYAKTLRVQESLDAASKADAIEGALGKSPR